MLNLGIIEKFLLLVIFGSEFLMLIIGLGIINPIMETRERNKERENNLKKKMLKRNEEYKKWESNRNYDDDITFTLED